MSGFYFAWVAEGVAFDPDNHNIEDEKIINFEIEHSEGDFASLKIEVRNPKVGLLGAGRNLWCWLSWDNDSSPPVAEPLFHGRLVGIPESLTDERVRLQFRARPNDFLAQKRQFANSLKNDPYWDPLWLQDRLDDDDTVLETYSGAWHINRTTLAVTASDLLIGEDGTLDVAASEHLYDALRLSYAAPPLKRVAMEATVTWTQAGTGTVDLTQSMVTAFQNAGSPMKFPLISSMTGDGLLSSWPKPKDSLGGGWVVGDEATVEWADWVQAPLKTYYYVKQSSDILDEDGQTTIESRPGTWTYSYLKGWQFLPDKSTTASEDQSGITWETWGVIYPLGVLKIYFPGAWKASRKRSETVTFTLEADIQPLIADPDESVTLTSSYVDQAIDETGSPGDLVMPISDARRNAFFTTDRGGQALRYLIAYCRARLRARARAIDAEFTTTFAKASGLDCRWNVLLHDDRLPGGQALGKVTRVLLSADGDAGELKGVVTIGIAIGHGNSVAPSAGAGVYAAPGYMQASYQIMSGAVLGAGTADVTYGALDEEVIDDDGIDLFNLTAASAVESITITDGVTDQLAALSVFKSYAADPSLPSAGDPSNNQADEPQTVLGDHYTKVTLNLAKISNQSFVTAYTPMVSELMIPQGIDLEAT